MWRRGGGRRERAKESADGTWKLKKETVGTALPNNAAAQTKGILTDCPNVNVSVEKSDKAGRSVSVEKEREKRGPGPKRHRGDNH